MLEEAAKLNVTPKLGVRVRLASISKRGTGKTVRAERVQVRPVFLSTPESGE